LEAIEIKRKTYFEFEDAPYVCLDVEVSKPTARGGQTLVRVKMRNLITRSVFDKTFKAGEKFGEPDLEKVEVSYQYSDGDNYHFMDQTTFDTLTLRTETLGEDRLLLADNLTLQVQKYNGNPIGPGLSAHRGNGCDRLRARRPRRHRERRCDKKCHARNGSGDPRAPVHQGRRESKGSHRNEGIRRSSVTSVTSPVDFLRSAGEFIQGYLVAVFGTRLAIWLRRPVASRS
jgi:translation elongation factor P/translation initiation factor 5A